MTTQNITPRATELTTVEAAEILNVSRPFVIKLMDEGRIPYRKVGNHCHLRLEDVIAFQEANVRECRSVLDRLAAEAQGQGMGYHKG